MHPERATTDSDSNERTTTLTRATRCRPGTHRSSPSARARARVAFFLPAALGIAALIGTAGPPSAHANDLSDSPCTAEDVEIVGSGIIVNEPCVCSPGSTFNARVKFTVRNNTSTGRYCVALHLVPDGTVLTASLDLVLKDSGGSSTAPGKSDTEMFGTIPNFPCNLGVVCFGQAGTVRGKCAPGTCTTLAWNTSPGAANCADADQTPPGGQCRHQQVCVVGYGASLTCTANCRPECGTASTLRACITASATRGPFTLALNGSDGSSQTRNNVAGDPSATTCVDFTVSPTQSPTTTYTLTVTDRDACTRLSTVALPVAPLTVNIVAPTSPGPCNGVLRYTASTSRNDCTLTWTIDGQPYSSFAAGGSPDDARVARVSGAGGNTLDFRALDNFCHTIQVSASCSSGGSTPCTGSVSKTARQCATSSLDCR